MVVESDETLREILDETETIAVVGCSRTPGKAAHDVPKYMLDRGYDVIPVNPYATEIFGRSASDSIEAVPEGVDMVNVFRPSAETGDVVDAATERADVESVWLQLGIKNAAAGQRVAAAGKRFVQDRCLKVEYSRLC